MIRISEIARGVTAWVLAVLMVIPVVVIWVADRLTLYFLRRRHRRD